MAQEKKSVGRPTLAAKERKSDILRIRLTENEKRLIQLSAEDESMDTSAWVRKLLISHLDKQQKKRTNINR